MVWVSSFLIGIGTYFLFKKIDFRLILKAIWSSNQAMLSIIQSNVSDDEKQAGILQNTRKLFFASIKLLTASMLIVLPTSLYYWYYRTEMSLNLFMIQTGLLNLAGIFVGVLLFRPK
jgi:hypothetical protein